jgi:predicted dehydrogenase
MAMDALRMDKNVICEKPLAVSLEQAEKLDQATRNAGLVASVPFVYWFYPMVREARDPVLAGEIRSIHLAHRSSLQDWLADPVASNWRVAAGAGGAWRAFADIGSHWCDLLEWVCRIKFERVNAICGTVYPQRSVGGGETFKNERWAQESSWRFRPKMLRVSLSIRPRGCRWR